MGWREGMESNHRCLFSIVGRVERAVGRLYEGQRRFDALLDHLGLEAVEVPGCFEVRKKGAKTKNQREKTHKGDRR